MPLLEVILHPSTQTKYTNQATHFYKLIGKAPVVVKKETPGFIASRLQAAFCNEAYSLVKGSIVSAELYFIFIN